jgi:hypothetical protein
MANVELKLIKAIELANTDSELKISNGKGKIGTLKLSRGGIEWWPSGNSANAHKCTWEKLATLLEKELPVKHVGKKVPAKNAPAKKAAVKKANAKAAAK